MTVLDNHMKQLSKELELEVPLEAKVPGVYNFPLEEGVTITISAMQPEGFSLAATIGPAPKSQEEMFFTQMLLANLFGQGTRGAVLGLDEDGVLMKLSRVVDYKVEYRDFRDILEDFINAVDFWRDEAAAKS